MLPNGIEVALKYTQTWGLHLEVEKTYEHAENLNDIEHQAKEVLDTFAQELGISYIDDERMRTGWSISAKNTIANAIPPDVIRKPLIIRPRSSRVRSLTLASQ